MERTRFTVSLPKDILPLIETNRSSLALPSDALYLYPFIKNDILSYGRVASILGISKWDLIQIYGDYGIPYIDMEMDELERDMEAVDRIRGIAR